MADKTSNARSNGVVGGSRRRWRKSVTGHEEQKPQKPKQMRLKLSDLHNDCLTHIFKYLNCNDVIKMFVVVPYFTYSARQAFKQVCRNEPLIIYLSPMDNDYMDPKDIEIALGNVGELARDIIIRGRVTDHILDRRDDDVLKTVIQFCFAVTDFTLQCIDTNIPLEYFRSFKELNKIKFYSCHLGGRMTQLQNVTHFHGTVVPEACLSFDSPPQSKRAYITQDDLLAFFNVNRQLRCVKLFVKLKCGPQCRSDVVTNRFLQCMDERLKCGPQCRFDVVTNRFLQCMDERLNVLEKLKLDLSRYNNNYSNSYLEYIGTYFGQISYQQLEEVTISATSASGRSLNLFHQCRNLRKLTLKFYVLQCNTTDIIDLVSNCRLLQFLCIKCDQDIKPQLVNRDFYKNICQFMRNRANIKIILSVVRQKETVIDETTVNHYNNFNMW